MKTGRLRHVEAIKEFMKTYESIYPKDYGTKMGVGYFVPGDYREEYLKDKLWKYYNEAGQLIREEYYLNGVLADVDIYER